MKNNNEEFVKDLDQIARDFQGQIDYFSAEIIKWEQSGSEVGARMCIATKSAWETAQQIVNLYKDKWNNG